MNYEKWLEAHGFGQLKEIFRDIDERLKVKLPEEKPEEKK